MKTYELTLVLTEEIGKDEAKQKSLLEELLTEAKAVVKEKNILGVRDLAYEIKKKTKGWYGIFIIEMPETKVAELDRAMRLKEEILRYLLIMKE
ncbi:MAG: 30S ribosomal protein S6 [Candidatus Beckwithbacteria bacterium]|nr:30S ribosomal protein S6 [Patescibacteria group bacterium]